jgi:hypothetical protein
VGAPSIGRAYAAGGRHEQAILDLRAVEDGSPSPSLRADALFERDPAFADAAATLARATDDVAASPRRSALTAGLLSAAVPGLGHAYAGDAWAGAGALALNAAFAWATWEAFDGGRPGLGLVLGAATSIWYGGAIFGAVAEVMRFNRDVRAERLEAAEARFRWVLEAAPLPGGGAAGVRGRF